jgi:hypothetical protein
MYVDSKIKLRTSEINCALESIVLKGFFFRKIRFRLTQFDTLLLDSSKNRPVFQKELLFVRALYYMHTFVKVVLFLGSKQIVDGFIIMCFQIK